MPTAARDSRIRRATRNDIPRIAEIRFAVHENKLLNPESVTPEHVLWFIDNPGIWLWEEGGAVKGFTAADTRDGSVWALFIDPDHEKQGIGRALFAVACDVLRAAGHREAWLRTGEGTRADRFYRRAGWTYSSRHASGDVVLRAVL